MPDTTTTGTGSTATYGEAVIRKSIKVQAYLRLVLSKVMKRYKECCRIVRKKKRLLFAERTKYLRKRKARR